MSAELRGSCPLYVILQWAHCSSCLSTGQFLLLDLLCKAAWHVGLILYFSRSSTALHFPPAMRKNASSSCCFSVLPVPSLHISAQPLLHKFHLSYLVRILAGFNLDWFFISLEMVFRVSQVVPPPYTEPHINNDDLVKNGLYNIFTMVVLSTYNRG